MVSVRTFDFYIKIMVNWFTCKILLAACISPYRSAKISSRGRRWRCMMAWWGGTIDLRARDGCIGRLWPWIIAACRKCVGLLWRLLRVDTHNQKIALRARSQGCIEGALRAICLAMKHRHRGHMNQGWHDGTRIWPNRRGKRWAHEKSLVWAVRLTAVCRATVKNEVAFLARVFLFLRASPTSVPWIAPNIIKQELFTVHYYPCYSSSLLPMINHISSII